MDRPNSRVSAWLAITQGFFYIAPGLWNLLLRRKYVRVHGLHSDFWLLNAHGLWLLLVGGALMSAGWRRQLTAEVRLLGLCGAVALAANDAVTGVIGRLPARIYVIDLVIEVAFAARWTWCLVWRGD